MSSPIEPALELPPHLPEASREEIRRLAERNARVHGEGFVGLILSGSAGRGVATARSDLDLYVVLSDAAARDRVTTYSRAVDEIPITLSELEDPPGYGTANWWYRWSFAWAPVILDRADGRVTAAARRQATLTADEQNAMLVAHDRLDGWVNFAYRALKSERDGRRAECRLDAAESVPWLLDVIFTLAGRVRPYNKYLAWELREHPLSDWPQRSLLTLVTRTLDGDPAALRESFRHIETACVAFDARRNDDATRKVIEGWGDELDIFRT